MLTINTIQQYNARIRLIKAAISEVERAYKADVSRAIGDYQGGKLDIFRITDKYAEPLEELQSELLHLIEEKEALEWEKSRSFWDMIKSQTVHHSAS